MRHKDFDLCAVLILVTMIVPRITITMKPRTLIITFLLFNGRFIYRFDRNGKFLLRFTNLF